MPDSHLVNHILSGTAHVLRDRRVEDVLNRLYWEAQTAYDTAKAADNFRIFQLYVRGDDAWVDDHVKRARDHGYAAFCLTVDTASYSRRAMARSPGSAGSSRSGCSLKADSATAIRL